MLWEERYLNVFFAYRGAGDLALSPGRQLEDNLTRALAVTLRNVSPATARSFAVDLCAIDPGEGELRHVVLQPQPGRSETHADRRVLLGVSPSGQMARGSLELDEGGSRPDAAFVWHGLTVFLESKVVADLDGGQLARHAAHFDLGKPTVTPSGLQAPESWKLRRWQQVAEWSKGAADVDVSPTGAFLLRELADYLDLAGVTAARPQRGAVNRRMDLPQDWPGWMEDLAIAAPLDEIAALCGRLYGDPESEWFVCGSGVKTPVHVRDDSQRVRHLYRAAGMRVPGRLTQNGGDVITARRYLSIAYGPDNFVRSFADDDLETRAGLVRGVGTDRGVLLGLFAWAWSTGGARAARVLQVVERVWPDAEIKTYAAPELHERLEPEALAALEIVPD